MPCRELVLDSGLANAAAGLLLEVPGSTLQLQQPQFAQLFVD